MTPGIFDHIGLRQVQRTECLGQTVEPASVLHTELFPARRAGVFAALVPFVFMRNLLAVDYGDYPSMSKLP